MPILNYTTTITTEKTAGEIQGKLAAAGAQAVMCEYDEDQVMESISFRINTEKGLVSFMLPANKDGVHAALVASNAPNRLKTPEQAARVAWRIVKDWVEAQLAIIEAGMADIIEVFLPYAQDDTGKTVYEKMKDSGFKLIAHKEEPN